MGARHTNGTPGLSHNNNSMVVVSPMAPCAFRSLRHLSYRCPQPPPAATRPLWPERSTVDDVVYCIVSRCRGQLLRQTSQALAALDWCALCVQLLRGGDRREHFYVASGVRRSTRPPWGRPGSAFFIMQRVATARSLPITRAPADSQRRPTPTKHATMCPVTVRHRCGGVGCVRSEPSSSVPPRRVAGRRPGPFESCA